MSKTKLQKEAEKALIESKNEYRTMLIATSLHSKDGLHIEEPFIETLNEMDVITYKTFTNKKIGRVSSFRSISIPAERDKLHDYLKAFVQPPVGFKIRCTAYLADNGLKISSIEDCLLLNGSVTRMPDLDYFFDDYDLSTGIHKKNKKEMLHHTTMMNINARFQILGFDPIFDIDPTASKHQLKIMNKTKGKNK